MDKIEGIVVTTTCANFREGGVLFITKDLTDLPLERALERVKKGLESNTDIRIPHKNYKGYTVIFPRFIVGYDVHMEEEV